MNSILLGTPDSTLKTCWVKGKTYFCVYFWKKPKKTILSIFLNKHWKKSLKNVPLYINFGIFERHWTKIFCAYL